MKSKEILIIIMIILLVGLFLFLFFYSLEKSWNKKDKVYEGLCFKENLIIYKSSPNKPHIDGCYKIEDGILKMYELRYFKDKYYLVEDNLFE